ncbi:DUF3298 and DUF4163 domain-containing protein [Formosa maritima]|uniref:DUF3298 and DUF4163 domain-containing protein n=1 Tax=Formosa maritima TaxID=2592046 RepID=A0A5D0GME4_9FLAO|nr:DUF3298 and DUF4163 domain-containing protein [Formosa maritima]TYA60208.1 DUF3298 and DUF4163 domain-containing protein [Formosa maritima]
MRFKFLVYTLIISLLSQTCKEEKTIEFKEINVTTSTNKIVEINIPEAFGDEEVSNVINKRINLVIISSLNVGEENSTSSMTVSESIDLFNKEYTTFKADFPESIMEWDAQIDGEIMYQSDEIVSIAITTYLNTGGAHGNLIIEFLNFDVYTGKQLKNEDLFQDYINFTEIAKDYFNEEIAYKKELYFEPDNFKLPENIGFNDEGAILLYNTYEIAPYSSGVTEINIPWEDLQNTLNFL